MDDENKPDQQNDQPTHEHVHIFGAEVDSGAGENGGGAERSTSDAATSGTTAQSKAEWRARRRQWKQEQRAQWKAQRAEWRQAHRHEGSMFWGLIILLVGVLALLDTTGYLSSAFWTAIVPFWPLLLILWGASLVLGRHWFARFIIFIFTIAFLVIVIIYGLVRTNSPLVSSLSPNVVQAVHSAQPPQY
ncbi:MAG TPA: DUF5668 domain-containing protein [Candidatus Paceibacterota bacterium]|nr:DUF5668 domain-containing protein [Candidatus Paceibacterota bacterium]